MGWLGEHWRSVCDQRRVFSSLGDMMLYRRVRDGQPVPQPVRLHLRALGGRALELRPGTTDLTVLWDTFHHGFHLPPRPLPADAVILDLGANAGYTAFHLAHLHPAGRLLAVEMDENNFALARRNLEPLFPRVSLVRAAVWHQEGEVVYGEDGEGEWGFHVMEGAPAQAQGRRRAPARTVGGLLKEHGFDRVDYVKMDIEGAEASVLAQDNGWLARVGCLMLETHVEFNPLASMERCAQLLEAKGFRCRLNHPIPWHVTALRGD